MKIELKGHLDTSTVERVKKDIDVQLAGAQPGEHVEVDCHELEYISSTGLRILIGIRKAHPDMEVVGVNNEVYNVFEMTGFSRIMTVKKALRKVDLSQCSLLAQGGNGAVYRINREEIIKVQHLADTDDTLNDEIRRAKSAFILGIPTAISYDIVDCGEGRHGAVYEALNSDTLGRYVHAHPEKLQECAVRYAELLKTLHSTEASDNGFVSIKESYRHYYELGAKYYTPEENAALQEILDFIPDSNTLVHADAHTNNILMGDDGELMFIDMADTDLGHPVFDYAGIALAMIVPLGSKDVDATQISGMSKEETFQFITIAFTHLLGLTDPADIQSIIPRLVSLSHIKHTTVIAHNSPKVNFLRDRLLAFLRMSFFNNIEEVKNNIKWFMDRLDI